MNFNKDGILNYKELGEALDRYKLNATAASHLRFGRHTEVALVNYLMGRSIEDIAGEMNVTRERVGQMLAKVQRKLGIQKPPSPIVEWVEESDMVDLKARVTFERISYIRTRRMDEKRGDLSLKEAEEAGFAVQKK